MAVARLEWEAGLLGTARASTVKLVAEAPEGVALPRSLKGASFGQVTVGGDRRLVFGLDLKRGGLWLDINLNGSLQDDRPLPTAKPGISWNQTPSVQIGKGQPVVLTFYRTATCKPDHVHYYPRMHRRGTVVLAGRVRLVGLADGNADLKFDDAQKDVLYLDLNGDGVLAATEAVSPGRPFAVRGQAFVASIASADGAVVDFRKADTAPAAARPAWTPSSLVSPAIPKARTGKSLADMTQRFERERTLAYTRRYATLRDIAALLTEKSFRLLERVARDAGENVSVRREAVLLMGHKSNGPYAQTVIDILNRESNVAVREQALFALYFMKHADTERLCRRMLASPTVVARGAATVLVLEGSAALVAQTVKTGANQMTRYYAYMGLRYSKEPPGLDLLRSAARDDYANLRAAAIADMARLGLPDARTEALMAAGAQPMPVMLANAVVDVLARAADPAAIVALFGLAAATTPAVVARIRKELGPVRDDAATAEYLKALRTKDAKVRGLAAFLLGALPGRKTTDALLKQARREKDPGAIQSILEALGEHADPRAISLLLSAAKKRDPALRAAAIRALARIGPGVPQVRRFFMRLLTAVRWEDRIYALDAAGEAGDWSVAPKVIDNLKHKVWQVRHAAAEALGKLRVRAGVPPMITMLAREQHKRVRAAVAHALWRTTGMNFYDFAETWARWWAEHGHQFKVPQEVPRRRKRQPGGSVASFYGLPLDSDRVIFVVDMSGSMGAVDAASGKSRLETAVAETLGAVGRLKPRDLVNMILFESRIHPWKPKLVPLNGSNRADLQKYLSRQRPTGGTNLYDGLELALLDPKVDTVFLLSDGAPGAGKFVHAPDILREVGRLNRTRRIAVHCVSVGTDSDLLKKLAAANGGQYVRR